jgi:hypothetical protein
VFRLEFDLSQLRALADDLHVCQDQVRFAAMRTINQSLYNARDELCDVWARHVQQRNPHYPRVALHVNQASKADLSGTLVETKGSILGDHDEGTTRVAAHQFAVPTTQYRTGKQTQHGLRVDARLATLLARPSARRSLIVKGNKVFVATRGQRGMRLAFVLEQAVTIKKDVPLTQGFIDSVLRTFSTELIPNMLRAMKTRIRFKS